MNLLIVDDSLVIRNKIGRSLLSQFANVFSARNGHEALELVEKHTPDVVTMDLTMPEMDGVESIRRIIRTAPRTRILVVSALADKATAIEALSLGANGFLLKPFTVEEINKAIRKVLKVALAKS